METIIVRSTPLQTPSNMNVNVTTLTDSRRNIFGVMIGRVIRESKIDIELEWNYLKADDWKDILTLFKGRQIEGNFLEGFINRVTFINPETGNEDTRDMYVSDRQAKVLRVDENGKPTEYVNCHLSLIEV